MTTFSVSFNDAPAPSPAQVVRALLARLGLPTELILAIMDLAEYHPSVRAERKDTLHITAPRGEPSFVAQLYLLSPPIPRDTGCEHWAAKKVIWRVEGHDQGWGGGPLTGRYHPAYSWYDACVFRRVEADASDLAGVSALGYIHRDPEDVAEVLQAAGWGFVRNGDGGYVWRVQSNRIAHDEFETHEVAWTPDQPGDDLEMRVVKECGAWAGDGFVRTLQPGDRVGLWMRATYPGWANYVKDASVEILYEAH